MTERSVVFEPRDPARSLRRWFLFLLIVHLVTSYFSFGIFHCDENYQIKEFVGYKLGWGSADRLAWEYEAQIRPWLQPFLYYVPVKALASWGVENPLSLDWFMRCLSGILGWGALTVLSRSVFRFLGRGFKAFWVTLLFSSFYFLPVLHVRTSSESMSAAFLMLSLATSLTIVSRSSPQKLSFALVGFFLGMAFEARFQTAFAGLGLALWLFFSTREKWSCAVYGVMGGVAAILLGACADRWGYGAWVVPAYRYATVNLVEGKAAEFGVSPWWWYFFAFRKMFVAPYGAALVLGVATAFAAAAFSARRFFSLVRTRVNSAGDAESSLAMAAVAVVVPFVLIHMLIGHKEERFLYPVVWAMWMVLLLSLALPLYRYLVQRASWQPWLRRAIVLQCVFSLVLLLRGAFLEINTHAPVFQKLQEESEKVQNLSLLVLEGYNPYVFHCDLDKSCDLKPTTRFLQPKNLTVDCNELPGINPAGALVLQTVVDNPLQSPSAPTGCREILNTRPAWVSVAASLLPEGLRQQAFKQFRFHVLWDCR